MENITTFRRFGENFQKNSKMLLKEALFRTPLPMHIGKKKLKKILVKFTKGPIVFYLIGGIGVYVMGKLAYQYYKTHPEMFPFFKEYTARTEKQNAPRH